MDSPDPAVRSRVAQDLVFLHFVGIKVVVVHGRKAVTKEMETGDWLSLLLTAFALLMPKLLASLMKFLMIK